MKILKIKLFYDGKLSNADLTIDTKAFEEFLSHNACAQSESVPESSLERSYIIIDNQGKNYREVGSLLEEDFRTIFKRYAFNEELYASRYHQAG